MFYALLAVHLLLCFSLISLVLLQQGKGADMGATLGGGANSVFGAGGATSVIVKATTGVAVAFMITTVLLIKAYTSGLYFKRAGGNSDLLSGSKLNEIAGVSAAQQEQQKSVDTTAKDQPVKVDDPAPAAVVPDPANVNPAPQNPEQQPAPAAAN